MLVNPHNMLNAAQAGGYAIGAFNTYNLEITLGILRAAEELNAPAILQVSASALKYAGDAALGSVAVAAATVASVPVAVHLDHARDLELVRSCLGRGFTSVMFDGSMLLLDDNIKRTKEAATLAHAAGVPVEGELGTVAGPEDLSAEVREFQPFTDPVHVVRYVKETGVDSLAVAIGNAHGFYKAKPKLDLQRLTAIHERTRVPLVLHGASGIPDEDILAAIQTGICKINVNTDIRCAFFDTVQETLEHPHPDYNLPDLMAPVIKAVSRVVKHHMVLYGSAGRAAELHRNTADSK